MPEIPWNLIGLALLAALTAIYVLCVNRDLDVELWERHDRNQQTRADLRRVTHPTTRPRSLR